MPFLHTKSRNIQFLSLQQLRSRSARAIVNAIKGVIKTYDTRGFRLETFSGDNEFNMRLLRDLVAPAHVHICGANEHVGPRLHAAAPVLDCREWSLYLAKFWPREKTSAIPAFIRRGMRRSPVWLDCFALFLLTLFL